MKWVDFIAQKEYEVDDTERHFMLLDADHCFRLSYGAASYFQDIGLPHETYDGRDMVLTGGIMNHRNPSGGTCGGFVNFANPLNPSPAEAARPVWTVEEFSPLTISPSVQCHCKGPLSHGFIRSGKWVAA